MEIVIFIGLIVLGYLIAYAIGWRFGKTQNVFLLALLIIMTCIGWPTIGFNYTLLRSILLGDTVPTPIYQKVLLPILFTVGMIGGFYMGYTNWLKKHPERSHHGIE